MNEHLLRLLDYQDVLGAVATTVDGLVVATAGLEGDDAEVVAAAAAAVARSLDRTGSRSGGVAVPGGVVHLVRGPELMLVALAEESVPGERLTSLMTETLGWINGFVSRDRARV